MPAPDVFPRYAELPVTADGKRSAWGVFGSDDQLGTLNHLTPERVRAACALVTEGERISLDHLLNHPVEQLMDRRAPYEHVVTSGRGGWSQDDHLNGLYPQYSSQWDSLRHVRGHEDGFYNGVSLADAAAIPGRLGIENASAQGIVGRGVLLDVAGVLAAKGTGFDPRRRREITAAELDEVLAGTGLSIEPGTVVLIRTGFADVVRNGRVYRDEAGGFEAPGLAADEDTLAWLWDHRVAAVVSDTFAVEAWPLTAPERFMHFAAIGLLGLTLGEMFDLDGLAAACTRLARHEFLFTGKPLALPGGVGSPANALAIL